MTGTTVSSPTKAESQWNPLAGINWTELRKAYQVFINHPSQGILHILAADRGSKWRQWMLSRLERQAAPLRNSVLRIDLNALSQLPKDTLGGAYAHHILSQGFDPEAFVSQTETHWLEQRLSLSHDVHHVITGFDGTPVGEFGLAAFVLVQYRDLLNVFVLSHLPWFLIGHPWLLLKTLRLVVKGFRMGLRCPAIVAYPFEQNWHKPLVQVRQELGIA